VSSGVMRYGLNTEKLRLEKTARFTQSFVGTTFSGTRKTDAKPLRLSLFKSGRFCVPGLKSLREAEMVVHQNLRILEDCRNADATQEVQKRCTTRKRRRTGVARWATRDSTQ